MAPTIDIFRSAPNVAGRRDGPLTSHGLDQCGIYGIQYLNHYDQPIGQEPENVGSELDDIIEEFGKKVETFQVTIDWYLKGPGTQYDADAAAVEQRARCARHFIRDFARDAGENGRIIVVSHSSFLHFLVEDFTGLTETLACSWEENTWRSFTFEHLEPIGGNDPASLIETDQSLRDRTANNSAVVVRFSELPAAQWAVLRGYAHRHAEDGTAVGVGQEES
ncbi:Uu.00g063730.m01.CDS01 [Anthostomella pinea]|uniref:Uu.00g063730.m01.CDS01 n=1 Tax=Anthostomella pinea TaxID=933095 RepID=A0AAI8VTG3_9PEZI|nr:Uu.00g063730.m01.CDS01 [Anthostomella pinea]